MSNLSFFENYVKYFFIFLYKKKRYLIVPLFIVFRKPPARPVVPWSFSGEIDIALLSVKVMQSGRRITTERRSL